MTPTIISGFLTYTLITALTPGPNNILALSSVNQYGFRNSLRTLAGMSAGFLALMLVCGAFTFSLISILPSATRWLVWAGAAYILWLAWRIANGLAPIFPDTFYRFTHYWFAAADIPVANDIPVHCADAIRCNVRRPPQGSLPLLTRQVLA